MDTSLPIIGVGASAGGLEALREFFAGYKGTTGMAFVVIQHLDPNHESLMAQLIERYTSMNVRQAEGGEALEADHVYVIPPGHGLVVGDRTLHLTEFVDPRGLRRPIDDFFESLAEDVGALSACVILSGTGGDGSRGLRAIKENGGVCLAQAPETARYDGMPVSAMRTGLVDVVAPPSEMLSYLRRFFNFQPGEPNGGPAEIVDHLEDLCQSLSQSTGHDFSGYKRSTMARRVARRMQVLGIDSATTYADRVRKDDGECMALFSDLLINVTKFFRDTHEFEALREIVVTPLIERAMEDDEIRVWVAGCSSGDEAYSMAMLFADEIEKRNRRLNVQIFATDIDEKMLSIARSGTYPLSSLSDIPAEYRQRFTIGNNQHVVIAPKIRDMVRFSLHSLIKDPPFSSMDLISCRNLLIYFEEALQRQVVPLFHFALRQGGFLFLGSSEAIQRYEDLFEVVDQSARVFRRRTVQGRYNLQIAQPRARRTERLPGLDDQVMSQRREVSAEADALRRIAESYAPVSLLVDAEGNLLSRWGKVGRYLDFPDRIERTVHVPSLARAGLRDVLGGLLRDVVKGAARAIVRDVEVHTDFGLMTVNVMCEPIDDDAYLVVIRESGGLTPIDTDDYLEVRPEEGQVRYLEEELQATRYRLRTAIEELETTNEELKSSNEEMMSMNEELQSTNEELTTVNDELKTKVDQLLVANADLTNFFTSTELVVVVVDRDLRVRSTSSSVDRVFPGAGDKDGTALDQLEANLTDSEFVERLTQAAKQDTSSEFRATSSDGTREFLGRATPYKKKDGSTDGAILVLTDVTETLALARDLEEERERLRLALEVARIGIWEYEPDTDITRLDKTERWLLNLGEGEGDTMERILSRMTAEDRDRVNTALRQAMDGTRDFDEVFSIPLGGGRRRWLHGLGKRHFRHRGRKFIGVTYDVTAERELLSQRELMIREMNHRLKNLFAIISALVSICAREAQDVDDFAMELRSRIRALGQSHSLTNEGTEVRRATLKGIVETVLEPARDQQSFVYEGLDLEVDTSQLTSLALIFHEWATNATKYGALTVPDGIVTVRVEDGEDTVRVEWIEIGKERSRSSGSGFGTALIEATALQLRAIVEGEETDEGFRRTLVFPKLV